MKKKMNNKGFTLIELITVIVVIAIIAVITFQIVTDRINSSKEKAYDIQVNNIEDAAKKYMLENSSIDKNHLNTICVTIKTLQEKGYLEQGNIINPMTSENFDVEKNYVKIKYDLDKNQYDYTFTDICTYTTVTPASETIITNNNIKNAGLYETTDSYVFKGESPNNYIEFNNATWRIISIDKETMMMKIINLTDNQKVVSENGFITDLNNDFTNGTTYSDTIKEKINNNSKWNSGVINSLESAQTLKSVEKQSNSYNTISLLTVGEYVDASLDKNCHNTKSCKSYLPQNKDYWLLNKTSDNKNWYVDKNNQLASVVPSSTHFYNVYPCLNLKVSAQISSGDGSSTDPYKLK